MRVHPCDIGPSIHSGSGHPGSRASSLSLMEYGDTIEEFKAKGNNIMRDTLLILIHHWEKVESSEVFILLKTPSECIYIN
jgi:hypothetical protein